MILEELKQEILDKEFTLLELDNKVEEITGSTTSVFEYDLERDIIHGNEGSCSYYIEYNDETNMNEEINVDFKIVEKNSNCNSILVKVIDVYNI